MKTLFEILISIEEYKWSDALFLPEEEEWNKETLAMILDPDDVESEEDDAPKEALDNGLMYVLDVQTIQGIVENYKVGHKDVTGDDLLEAFLYYYDNDAYI